MNDKKSLLVISHFDAAGATANSGGDGYSNIAVPICNALTEKYNVFTYGLAYNGNEHYWKFGVSRIKQQNIPNVISSISKGLPDFGGVLVIMDIPLQMGILSKLKNEMPSKYIGVFAVESDPLTPSWAMNLLPMHKRFAISQFGTDECLAAGIEAEHLVVPVDSETWKKRTLEEKNVIKEALGFQDKIILFMNADGNERKNIGLLYQTLPDLLKVHPNVHLVLLTRPTPMSWNLDDLGMTYGVSGNVTVMRRGISQEEVRKLYVMSDFVLNVTKAEGLGMSVLEAQAVGVPVIATACTGMLENIKDGRGIGINPDFMPPLVDIFGNGHRYFVNKNTLLQVLVDSISLIKQNPNAFDEMVENAYENVKKRTVENAANQIIKVLEDE